MLGGILQDFAAKKEPKPPSANAYSDGGFLSGLMIRTGIPSRA